MPTASIRRGTASADLEARSLPRIPAGFDPLIAGKPRWSAVIPSLKAPSGSLPAFISTTALEAILALWLELHPLIIETGRVDLSDGAARRYGLQPVTGFEVRYPILAVSDGKPFYYLPDAAARWADGTPAGAPVLAEAGLLERKTTPESRDAFDAARRLLGTEHGHFFVLLEDTIRRGWYRTALALHLWRFACFAPAELVEDITSAWQEERTPRELVTRYRDRSTHQKVLHAVMKAAGDALAAGRLKVDLRRTDVHLDTPLRVLPPGAPLILPPHVPNDVPPDTPEPVASDDGAGYIKPEGLATELAAHLEQRKADVEAILEGRASTAEVADRWGQGQRWVQMVTRHYREVGDPALIRYFSAKSREGVSTLDPRIKNWIKRRLTRDPRRIALDLVQDQDLRELCETKGLAVPSRRRVQRYMDGELSWEMTLPGKTSKSRSLPVHEKVTGFTAVYQRPGFILEGDEAIGNLTFALAPGTTLTDRIHEFRLNDVATKVPVSLVTSPRVVDAGDLRRALLRAARPKEGLLDAAGSEMDWPVEVWGMVLRLDNAWLGMARMFLRVLPNLGVMLEYTPAKRPQAKSTAESAIGRDQVVHENRQPNTTKGDVLRRGTSQPEEEAARKWITPEQIEADLMQQTVGVFHGFDKQAGMRRSVAWSQAVAKYGVRTWEGDPGELVRHLQHPIGEVTYHAYGVHYRGRTYVNTWAGDPDRDPRRDLPYPVPAGKALRPGQHGFAWIDEDDIRTMDIFDLRTGAYRGALVTNKDSLTRGRPVSESTLQFEKELQSAERRQAESEGQADLERRRLKNQRLPAKRVARAIAQIEHKVQRRAEALGVVGAQPRPPPASVGPVRDSEPPSPRRLTARPGDYAHPYVEVKEDQPGPKR